jgi:UDP-3-O-[3-hydroxymyristoyl] glucosamine N-acyltransferase
LLLLSTEYVGDTDFPITGMNDSCRRNWRYFVDHPKYYDKALNSAATIVLINKNVACPEGKALLISEDPLEILIN